MLEQKRWTFAGLAARMVEYPPGWPHGATNPRTRSDRNSRASVDTPHPFAQSRVRVCAARGTVAQTRGGLGAQRLSAIPRGAGGRAACCARALGGAAAHGSAV